METARIDSHTRDQFGVDQGTAVFAGCRDEPLRLATGPIIEETLEEENGDSRGRGGRNGSLSGADQDRRWHGGTSGAAGRWPRQGVPLVDPAAVDRPERETGGSCDGDARQGNRRKAGWPWSAADGPGAPADPRPRKKKISVAQVPLSGQALRSRRKAVPCRHRRPAEHSETRPALSRRIHHA